MRAKSGFTLVEILIVVVILGILAAIVIPQFTNASTEAKQSSLQSDLQMLRSQIELYKIQHNDFLPPGTSAAAFETAMTTYTMADGSAASPQAPGDGVYGPYMRKIPSNQFVADVTAAATVTPGTGTCPQDGSSGWWYNTADGDIRANSDKAFWANHINY
ncbi:MAG: prepilin-type N-terminal cleavage/methylation domain-containing protein [Planctomycetota bacterium]|nr:prepilin-type N-terminal cleavage/methylation domain-containing protein [Planctomycetota bacterium]